MAQLANRMKAPGDLALRWKTYDLVKKVFDQIFSIVVTVLVVPIGIIIAICIVVDNPGPVFYCQQRVGKNQEPFQIIKFRTMRLSADAEFDGLARECGYETNSVQFKLKNDPRVTRFGKILRRLSLDELPQILNVLMGQMSFVGPRPHVPLEVSKYPLESELRHVVRPGITGLWQVSGRSNLAWEESISLDLEYVRSRSFAKDFQILCLTPVAVLSGRGAY